MASRPLRSISVCSGIGGLDLGLRRWARTVCYVERDPYCVAVLRERVADGRLDDAPIWDDVATFDAAPWRGRVDLVAGGIPCQPHSCAGERKAGDDERDLWPAFLRIVRDARPRFALVENVAGLVTSDAGRFFAGILCDLAALGYDAAWTMLRASDVGAPHRRERIFILAWDRMADAGCVGGERRRTDDVMARASRPRDREGAERQRDGDAVGDCGAAVADGDGDGLQRLGLGRIFNGDATCGHDADGCDRAREVGDADGERRSEGNDGARQECARRPVARRTGNEMADANSARREGAGPDAHEGGRGPSADRSAKGNWETQSRLGRVPDGAAGRMDGHRGWPAPPGAPQFEFEPPRTTTETRNRRPRLRALGNGVVPAQAEAAFEWLLGQVR